MTQQIALILGPTGKFGRNAATAFAAGGWQVRRFDRKADRLDDAATGADVIVMGWHPPSYETWEAELLPLHARVIAAARRSGATVIVPGNVYNFGPDAPAVLTEDTPHRATQRLGRLRIAMEQLYRDAGVRTILLRAGDFLDTEASGNWFDRFIAKNASRGSIAYMGDPDVPHAWAYLPDLARAAVMLAERRDSLDPFEEVPFAGYTLTGRELGEAIGAALHREVAVKRFGWWQFRLLRPVMPVLRGVFEMRYLWDMPHRLDGTKLARLCPEFTPTPVTTALRAALAHQLPDAAPARAAA